MKKVLFCNAFFKKFYQQKEEEEMKMRQEFRRLKEKDKLENYDRNRRRNVLEYIFC